MGFNDLLNIEPVSSSVFEHMDEIESEARSRLATRMQTSLRSVVDPGVNLRDAVRAQTIKVIPEGERFAVRREDQGNVLDGGGVPEPEEDPNEIANVDQLFELGSGVPTAKANGSLVYRTVSPEVLFGEQRRAHREQIIEQAVANSLTGDLIESYDEAFNDVRQRIPGTK